MEIKSCAIELPMQFDMMLNGRIRYIPNKASGQAPVLLYDINNIKSKTIVRLLSLSKHTSRFWTFIDGSLEQTNLKIHLTDQNINFANSVTAMHEITGGLNFLHNLDPPVIYSSVSPADVLITKTLEGNWVYRLEVPDYCSMTNWDCARRKAISSAMLQGTPFGSECYFLPPETYNDLTKTTCNIPGNIYSLGLVFTFLLRQNMEEYEVIAHSGKFIYIYKFTSLIFILIF